MTKVAVVIGTRPELIKLAPVVRALHQRLGGDEVTTYSTGQHRDLLDQALENLKIKIDVDFKLMTHAQSSSDIQNKIVAALRLEFNRNRPDVVVVQGDTVSAFSGALAGFLSGIAVVHVEAGLRTLDLRNPWPEEGLRQMIARVTALHLAPTPQARQNLLREGIPDDTIHVVGNPGIDTLVAVRNEIAQKQPEMAAQKDRYQKLIIVTMHRREALDGDLDQFCLELKKTISLHPECCFLWPMHPNPEVRQTIAQHFGNSSQLHNLRLAAPLTYEEMISMLAVADLVVSDSGGMQEEAPYCGVPVIVVREVTERPEIIDLGLGCLIGSKGQNLSEAVSRYLNTQLNPQSIATWQEMQGHGKAAIRISEIIDRFVR